jgi:flagellar basal body-associated protein FliL
MNIKKQLENMKPKPITENEKHNLWASIQNKIASLETIEQKSNSLLFNPFKHMNYLTQKVAIAMLLIVAILGGSAATVAASNDAKPGDILFPIDLAVEKVQLIFADSEEEDDLLVEFAGERLAEVRIILAMAETEEDEEEETAHSTSSGQATSTDDGTQATSTDTTTDTDDKDGEIKVDIKKSDKALETAIEYLEKAKATLGEKGNDSAVAAIEGIMGQLTGIADNHLEDLHKFRAKIKTEDKKGKTKIEVDYAVNNLRTRFKLEQKDDELKLKYETKENRGQSKLT